MSTRPEIYKEIYKIVENYRPKLEQELMEDLVYELLDLTCDNMSKAKGYGYDEAIEDLEYSYEKKLLFATQQLAIDENKIRKELMEISNSI